MSSLGYRWGKPIAERFWSKVIKKGPDECWPWIGYVNKGRASFRYQYYIQHAHRVAWILTKGDIPANCSVRHSCFNKTCCNPGHLYLREMRIRS